MYGRMLTSYPLLTKSATSLAMLGAGDLLSQLVVERTPKFDYVRSIKFAALGGTLVGPTLHFWYGWLGSTGYAVTRRVAMDQFLFAPTFLSIFVGTMAVMDGKDPVATVKSAFAHTMIANWCLWLPYQFFVFNKVPLSYQVLANNGMGVIWNCFMSWHVRRHGNPISNVGEVDVRATKGAT